MLWAQEDTQPYECDGLTAYRRLPMVVALPETEEQVQRVLKICSSMKIPVVPRGAMDWSTFSPANISYEYLEPGIAEKGAEQTIVFQCPIHGSVGLGDGSVQMGNQRLGRNRK